MMYSPAHYSEDRSDLIFEVIKEYGFATIITQGTDGPFISHLPLILEVIDGKRTLIGHCARANPQWKHFTAGQLLTVVFNGPHAYISPSWYQPRPDNVPTWNYASVHVQGTATVHLEPSRIYEVLQKSVTQFEDLYQTGWQLPPTPNQELETLINGIVAFSIEIKSVHAKFKLSQKQDATDRDTVMKQLPRTGDVGEEVADYMQRVMRT